MFTHLPLKKMYKNAILNLSNRKGGRLMTHLRKATAAFLILTLLLSVFAGCAPEENLTGTEGTSENLTSPAPTAQGVNMLLGEEADSAEEYEPDFVSVRNVSPDFAVTVNAPADYTADKVLAGMTLLNLTNPALTDPEETDLLQPDRLTAEGRDGTFTVTCEGGFNDGEVYQLVLTDDALTYDGETDAVRFYNLTTEGKETQNLRLAGNVRFLSAAALNGSDAESALRFDGIFRYDAETGKLRANNGGGSFTYQKDAYRVGDIVAVYEGTQPDARALDDTESGVSYLRVTAVTPGGGATAEYAYEAAAPEDVLFTPDIIPVEGTCLQQAGETGSVTVSASALTYAADGPFAGMGLDENTVVEPGDFLAFYTGDIRSGDVSAYAEITAIEWEDNPDIEDSAHITYTVAPLDDVLTSADVYREGTLSEAQIRASYNEDAIRAGVIEDLTNNGYLTESTYNLAQIALDTDEGRALLKGADLDGLTFYYGEDEAESLTGKEFRMIADGRVPNGADVKGDADVMISPNIVHFAGKTGYGMGVRVEANAKFVVTIRDSDAELSKAGLRITITFFFETELVMGYTLDATSVWKKWWIFPYLYDYNVSGSCSAGIYVGVGFTAQATLFENKGDAEQAAANAGIPWPEGVDRTPGAEKVKKIAESIQEFGKKHDSIFPQQDTGGGSLTQKYAAFIKGADKTGWVDIINENIFDWNGAVDPWHVLAFRIKADFIVAAQLNAAIGAAANYERSYRSTFSFMLFHKEENGAKTDETDTSLFRADFYIFGAMGIRVGIRLTVAVGLFDARLDSVGIEIEAGLYQRLWGFFYAGIEINDVGGKDPKRDMYYGGAFLAETGGYYGFTFVAQAGDGAIAYRKYMGGGEYPFLQLGTDTFVNDFAYGADDDRLRFYADYTGSSHSTVIPENLFMMTAMGLKDGAVSTVSKSGYQTKDLFDITFDDPNFSYDYVNGVHRVTRKDAPGGEGTVNMTIRWKGNSFQTLSTELERTATIHWVANKRTMKFLNRDGSVFFMTAKPEGTALTADDLPKTDPVWEGFSFTGWLQPDGSPLTEMPTEMPNADTTYTSGWVGVPVAVNVRYYVPFYTDTQGRMQYQYDGADRIEDLFRNAEKVENALDALTAKHLLRSQPEYDLGGRAPYQSLQVNRYASTLQADSVQFDGSTTFTVYLDYVTVPVTFDNGDGTKTTTEQRPEYYITFPAAPARPGYRFLGWADEDGSIVNAADPIFPTKPTTFTAQWEKLPATLRVRCQVKVKSKWGMSYSWDTFLDQSLTFDGSEVRISDVLSRLSTEGYTFAPDYSAWKETDTVTLAEDGSTAITLRFTAG